MVVHSLCTGAVQDYELVCNKLRDDSLSLVKLINRRYTTQPGWNKRATKHIIHFSTLQIHRLTDR
jgi:hypothetical protein